MSAHQGGQLAPIDSCTLRGDLLVLTRRLVDTLTSSHGSLILALLHEAATDPNLCELIEQGAGQTGARLPDAVLRRAIGRGDLPETATTYPYDELVGSVLIVRALVDYPMDDTYLTT